ncbi:MAG: entericidin A/B family lipoprotein [Phycisphaerales bacterium]|nr:entericidin A/B family lipoprotein [Phycisphaerales bacterium]
MLLLACFGMTLSACNTVEGFGKDIQAAGSAIDDAASDDDDDGEEEDDDD